MIRNNSFGGSTSPNGGFLQSRLRLQRPPPFWPSQDRLVRGGDEEKVEAAAVGHQVVGQAVVVRQRTWLPSGFNYGEGEKFIYLQITRS